MVTIYLGGGEDTEFYQVGGGTITTSATQFRPTFARCGLQPAFNVPGNYWQNRVPFSASSFWFGGRIWNIRTGNNAGAGAHIVEFLDASYTVRMYLAIGSGSNYSMYKVDALNTSTLLATGSMSWSVSSIDKLDINVIDSVTGSVSVYLNGQQVITYSGDTTTDGVTSIANVRLYSANGNPGEFTWSEIVVSDADTRSMSLQTLAPVANGNTHNFDTGTPAAANVNEVTINDATIDGSSAAGQLDQYTIPAIAAGTFAILAVGVSARMQTGFGGPQHADLNVRSAGADYFSPDQTPGVVFGDKEYWWYADPATSASWTGLPTNIGVKSVA